MLDGIGAVRMVVNNLKGVAEMVAVKTPIGGDDL